MSKTILITGNLGFIGNNMVKYYLDKGYKVVGIDKIDKISTPHSIKYMNISDEILLWNYYPYYFDINDTAKLRETLFSVRPDYIIHAAAGSAVDTSILHPEQTLKDNVLGTQSLLTQTKIYLDSLLDKQKKENFKFIHVSTDEVYGELHGETDLFSESSPYAPTSAYAVSKAASDFLVKSYIRTWNFPAMITNCCNNYGKFQFPEKLIPAIITNALRGKDVLIHGNGKNIRDWIHVNDHISAIDTILERGTIGEQYCIGARCEKSNIEIAKLILNYMDEKFIPPTLDERYIDLIKFGADRPGNDKRYGVDNSKLLSLGWKPSVSFDKGLKETVDWYEANQSWWKDFSTSAKVW